ncbi:MAG: nuclear transport factor 2 family protein [Gemmatimonadota bacterium]|nr:nuclear transport factor 2 family protein [Gemmatimonadota bacterium]
MNSSSVRTLLLFASIVSAGCTESAARALSTSERAAIADSLKHLVTSTYDLSKPNAVARLMNLYPAEGPVISANSGRATTTRAALQSQVETFWQYVGSNMRNPRWEWTSMNIDVLSPSAAVMTATYRVPHLNPHNTPHVIGGAWTAVFANREGRWVIVQEHLSDVPAQVSAPAQPDTAAHQH